MPCQCLSQETTKRIINPSSINCWSIKQGHANNYITGIHLRSWTEKQTWDEVSCHSSQILSYRRLTLQLVNHHTPTNQGIFNIFYTQSGFYQNISIMQTNTIMYCNGNILPRVIANSAEYILTVVSFSLFSCLHNV